MNFKKKQEVLTILYGELGTYQRTTDDNYKFHCPFCNHHKKKLEIHITNQKWQCWVCGTGGRKLSSLLYRLNSDISVKRKLNEIYNEETVIVTKDSLDSLFDDTTTETETTSIVHLPNGFIPLYNTLKSKDPFIRNVLSYLQNRNITIDHILKYNIGIVESGEWKDMIIIPSYDKNGDLNYFIGRTIYNDSWIKYKNPNISKNVIIFENHINWKLPIVLCEGVFDAISISRNSIPILGMNLPEKLKEEIFKNNVKHIYFAFDNEKKAVEKSIKLANYFSKNGIKITLLNLPEKDPSDIGFEGMTSIIKKSISTEWDDMVLTSLQFI